MTNTLPSDKHNLNALHYIISAMFLRDSSMNALKSLYIQSAVYELKRADNEVRGEGPRTMQHFDPTNDAK